MKAIPHRTLAGFAALAALLLASSASAFWPTDGRMVLDHTHIQAAFPAADGHGGAYLAYTDSQSAATNVYVHHVLASGELDSSWPTRGKKLTSGTAGQVGASIYGDGAGNWFVYYQDSSNIGNPRFRALRMASDGTPYPGWPTDGVFATPNYIDQTSGEFSVSPDGNGGGFSFWSQDDGASGMNIHALHYGPNGSLASGWPAEGKTICAASGNQDYPRGFYDGSGGMYLAWLDYRSNGAGQIYGERIDGSGNPVSPWSSNGTPLITGGTAASSYFTLGPDGAGGLLLAWGNFSNTLHAMRVSPTGADLWPDAVNGVQVCGTTGQETVPLISPDGAGGAMFGWSDFRAGFLAGAPDIYAQHVGSSGAVGFAPNGDSLVADSSYTYLTGLAPTVGNGAIFVWASQSVSFTQAQAPTLVSITENVYAQSINSSGGSQWGGNGRVTVCGSGAAFLPFASSDLQNGVFVAWPDTRTPGDTALYMARVSASGVTGPAAISVSSIAAQPVSGGVGLSWSAFISGSATFQVYRSNRVEGPYQPVGAAIEAMSNQRDFSFRDTGIQPGATYYYQLAWREQGDWTRSSPLRVEAGGATFALRRVSPNPARGQALIEYELSRAGHARIEVCDLTGRHLRTILNAAIAPGMGSVRWDGRSDTGQPMPSGAYFVRLTFGAQTANQKIVWMR